MTREQREDYINTEAVRLIVDYVKRCQYLESRIEQLALRGGHVQVNDNGTWKSVTEWAESVIRGDDVSA